MQATGLRPAVRWHSGRDKTVPSLLLTSDTTSVDNLSEPDTKRQEPPMSRHPEATPPAHNDIVRGTLDLLILKALSLEPMHGWAIAQRLEQLSRDVLRVGQGSLYPALQRLEEKGWVESDWRGTDAGRRAKYYELTRSGRRALEAEAAQWRRYVDMVELILLTP